MEKAQGMTNFMRNCSELKRETFLNDFILPDPTWPHSSGKEISLM
jgi:hypothetical protein